jgi:hypothetical protein
VVSTPVRLVVGQDDLLLREGVVRLLTETGFEVVAQAGDAALGPLADRVEVTVPVARG